MFFGVLPAQIEPAHLLDQQKKPPGQQLGLKGRLGGSGGKGNRYCTLISSTSKTRVEFGPMTGPAPFSP
jgi:hypothetical protein